MRVLLDTNALLWQLGIADQGSLGKRATALMQQADEVCVSSISIVEMHIKTMINKLDAPIDCTKAIENAGNTILPFEATAGDAIRKFPELIRHDPFDRMILAHARTEGLTLVTSDRTLLNLHLEYVIDAEC